MNKLNTKKLIRGIENILDDFSDEVEALKRKYESPITVTDFSIEGSGLLPLFSILEEHSTFFANTAMNELVITVTGNETDNKEIKLYLLSVELGSLYDENTYKKLIELICEQG